MACQTAVHYFKTCQQFVEFLNQLTCTIPSVSYFIITSNSVIFSDTLQALQLVGILFCGIIAGYSAGH